MTPHTGGVGRLLRPLVRPGLILYQRFFARFIFYVYAYLYLPDLLIRREILAAKKSPILEAKSFVRIIKTILSNTSSAKAHVSN